jgi:hypothetical protein
MLRLNPTKWKLLFFVLIAGLLSQILFIPTLAQNFNEDSLIPSWFKINVKWWQDNRITDNEIIDTIKFLSDREIIKLDSDKTKTTLDSNSTLISNIDDKRIPIYMKNVFGFWEKGLVSDSEIIDTIKYLVEKNIMKISSTFKQSRPLAAIIDVLDDSSPNKPAQQNIRQYLEKAGYDVDIYTTKDTTVDFYKKLPSMNYEFIYIRTHSLEVPELKDTTFLFSGEKYNINKYFTEQLSGEIARGIPFYQNESVDISKNDELYKDEMFFMISPKFVDENMIGKFPHSIIFIGGCESIKNQDMARSLVSRGASGIIGWNDTIGVGDNDRAMVTLFESILIKKAEISDSIESVMEKYRSNMQYRSTLQYFHP